MRQSSTHKYPKTISTYRNLSCDCSLTPFSLNPVRSPPVLGGSTDKGFPRHGKRRPRISDGSCQILFHVSIDINETIFAS